MSDNRVFFPSQPIKPIQSPVVNPRSAGMANTIGNFRPMRLGCCEGPWQLILGQGCSLFGKPFQG